MILKFINSKMLYSAVVACSIFAQSQANAQSPSPSETPTPSTTPMPSATSTPTETPAPSTTPMPSPTNGGVAACETSRQLCMVPVFNTLALCLQDCANINVAPKCFSATRDCAVACQNAANASKNDCEAIYNDCNENPE